MIGRALVDEAIDAACVDERRRIARWLMSRAIGMRSVKAAKALENAAADLIATDSEQRGRLVGSSTKERPMTDHKEKHDDKKQAHQTEKTAEKAAKQTAKQQPGELKPTESPGASQKEKDDLGQGGH